MILLLCYSWNQFRLHVLTEDSFHMPKIVQLFVHEFDFIFAHRQFSAAKMSVKLKLQLLFAYKLGNFLFCEKKIGEFDP